MFSLGLFRGSRSGSGRRELYLIPVAVGVGVFRYNLLGIEVVLRRGLVYGALTAVVVTVYLAVSVLAGTQLRGDPLPGVVAAALVAVALTPLRDRLQHGVDRLVYGERQDPLRAVTRLGDQVAADEPDLLSSVLRVITTAVRAPGATVTAPDGRLVAEYGSATPRRGVPAAGRRRGGRHPERVCAPPVSRTPREITGCSAALVPAGSRGRPGTRSGRDARGRARPGGRGDAHRTRSAPPGPARRPGTFAGRNPTGSARHARTPSTAGDNATAADLLEPNPHGGRHHRGRGPPDHRRAPPGGAGRHRARRRPAPPRRRDLLRRPGRRRRARAASAATAGGDCGLPDRAGGGDQRGPARRRQTTPESASPWPTAPCQSGWPTTAPASRELARMASGWPRCGSAPRRSAAASRSRPPTPAPPSPRPSRSRTGQHEHSGPRRPRRRPPDVPLRPAEPS